VFLALLVFLGMSIYSTRGVMKNNNLKVAFPQTALIHEYDPAKIYYAHQYILLENLYCSLMNYSLTGELVSSIAERFEWIGSDAYFTLRKGLKTVDGHEINARDVEVSLKRLFILQSNTHGDLKKVLCGKSELKEIGDICPNLLVKDDYTVVMKLKKRDPFLFSMLTSADFSIIPRRAIDFKTLKILDYQNTSGPYYVRKDNGGGNIELEANLGHFYYSKDMPQKVKFIPSLIDGKSNSIRMFKEKKVDFVTTLDGSLASEVLDSPKTRNDVNLFKSIPIKLIAITFTPAGESRFSVAERFTIASLAKKAVLPFYLNRKGAESTIQIFPSFGQGALTGGQINTLQKKFSLTKADTFKKRFTAWNFPKESLAELSRYFPNAEFKQVKGLPGRIDYKGNSLSEPELFLQWTDTSIKEDISFFSYYMTGYFFSIHGAAGAAWIKRYSETADLDRRMKMCNKLHYDTVSKAITVPLTLSPYVAFARKPWKFRFLTLHAGTTFWRLRCN